jgi:hypothetical protein|tara:strand:- start:722 stop:973 length:252 start_codon:yes stop_codon:yes gene_type:complete
MQKFINVLACLSFGISSGIVAGGMYIYFEKDNIIESAKENITKEIQSIVENAFVSGLNTNEIPSVGSGANPEDGMNIPSIPSL